MKKMYAILGAFLLVFCNFVSTSGDKNDKWSNHVYDRILNQEKASCLKLCQTRRMILDTRKPLCACTPGKKYTTLIYR